MDDLVWATATVAEVPAGDDWLGSRERAVLAGLRFAPRRESWRLGRFTARRLLGADVEILAGADGAPRAWRGARELPLTVSLSHRDDVGLCAAGSGPLGCDLERIEPRSAAFVAQFLTGAEQAAVAAAPEPELTANLIWSAKESALKLLRVGLGRDAREVEVTIEGEGLCVEDRVSGRRYAGFWRRHGGAHLMTFVTGA